MPVPNPVRLFHITAIANLDKICEADALVSKKLCAEVGIKYQNIAYRGAQGARAVRAMPIPPGGVLHDYVPFYFAPRSPMLRAIEGGKVADCPWRQADIVHLETTVDHVTADGRSFVFYDRNATLAFSQSYTDLAKLDQVSWELLTEPPRLDGFCKYWQNRSDAAKYVDRMERRQAEFLVKDVVPLGQFIRIGVFDEQQAIEVNRILAKHVVKLPVNVMHKWYFLPGQ